MATIMPLHLPSNRTDPITHLCQQCECLRFRIETAPDFETQRAHHAMLERALCALSQRTPETRQEAQAYSKMTILQLECMIAAWDDEPTPAEALLLQMLEQIHAFLCNADLPPTRPTPA